MQLASSNEHHNALLLSLTQALALSISIIIATLAGLTGLDLAHDKSWATLPISMMTVASALTMIPAALLMQRTSRRMGFSVGALCGIAAGLLACYAVWQRHFVLLVCATMLVGIHSGFAQYYRFAAADSASDAFRSRAISWVVAGGVAAALFAPLLVRWLEAEPNAWPAHAKSYMAIAVLAGCALLVIATLRLPPMRAPAVAGDEPARTLAELARTPQFLTAVICSTVGYAMMVMVMTATPLAMRACGQTLTQSSMVIQWHVLGMFVPSLFTGSIIARIGVLRVIAVGIVLMALHVAVALSGLELMHFALGLTLLGVGWNFLFIGGTTLLTQAYRASERAKAQATHDFVMFGFTAIASLGAGGLLNHWGWRTVNYAVLPFLLLAMLSVLWLVKTQRAERTRLGSL